MSCNCKKGKGTINNLNNRDYIEQAKQVYNDIIINSTEYTEVEKTLIIQTYYLLYPASKVTPTIEEAINQIKLGIEVYDIRKRK